MQDIVNLAPSILILVKIMVLFFLFLYIIFAAVVVRQVRIMTDTLQVGLERQIKLLAFAHFVFSVLVFAVSLIIL